MSLDWLIDTVFPYLGNIFGQISTLAMSNYNTVVNYIFGVTETLTYTNMFNGEVYSMSTILSTDFLVTIFTPLREFMLLFSSLMPFDMPFCLGIVLCFTVIGLGISIAKFFVGILNNIIK